MKPRHLYVHAGFCARRCSYCDFAVHVAAEPPVTAWARALGLELASLARERDWAGPIVLETLYLGGGTPSLLGPAGVPRMLEALGDRVDRGGIREFTAEANPERFDAGVARAWVAAGVDRVSFGVQTFHAPSLRWMGRLHGPDGPRRAVDIAREAGIRSLSVDLIFGLPDSLGRDLDRDLDRALALGPDHVSVYGLTVEAGTPLARWVENGRAAMPGEERYREQYLQLARRLTDAGYLHYEVSNFARPGREALHNAAYWADAPYLGLGNGAHSFLAPERWWNHRDWHRYREAVERSGTGRAGSETLGPAERRLERLWLGLRTWQGVPVRNLTERQRRLAQSWQERGWAYDEGAAVRLTPEGWLLLDRLALELDGAADGVEALERAGPQRQIES